MLESNSGVSCQPSACSENSSPNPKATSVTPESYLLVGISDLIEALDKVADALADNHIFEVSIESLQTAQHQLRGLEDRIHAARLIILPVIEAAGLWATGPEAAGTFASWLTRTDDIARATANREIRDAAKLRDHLPESRAAALAGDISAGQVEAMLHFGATSEARNAALRDSIAENPHISGAQFEPPRNDYPNPVADNPAAAEVHDEPQNPEASASGVVRDPSTDLPTGEGFLLGYTSAYPLWQFRRLVQRFAHVADPDADERGYTKAEEREYLNLSPTMGGWDIRGFLIEEHGQQLATAITAIITSNSQEPIAGAAKSSPLGISTSAWLKMANATELCADRSDKRTPGQRRATALADIARLTMDTGMLGGGAIERRQMVVNVSWREFHRALNSTCVHVELGTIPLSTADASDATRTGTSRTGTGRPGTGRTGTGRPDADDSTAQRSTAQQSAVRQSEPHGTATGLFPDAVLDPDLDYATWGNDRGPIPASVLKRIACDCDIRRVVFGPDGQILDVGRTYRVVPAHIRTAVIARDRHCCYPGCDQPPERCEVHHAIRHWADGGETSTENSALLCWHHHKMVDETGISMRPRRGFEVPHSAEGASNRYWRFHTHNGQEILEPVTVRTPAE